MFNQQAISYNGRGDNQYVGGDGNHNRDEYNFNKEWKQNYYGIRLGIHF